MGLQLIKGTKKGKNFNHNMNMKENVLELKKVLEKFTGCCCNTECKNCLFSCTCDCSNDLLSILNADISYYYYKFGDDDK